MRPPQITDAHLGRKAIAYLRQSSNEQVRVNVGSTAVQRDLPSMLETWGWSSGQIEVIENDLGVSGSIPGHREGFTYLLEQMSAGIVGIVAVTDSSRLARNLQDLAAFDQVARQHDVLLASGGQITDFRDPNGAFVGTILGANAARENQARVEMSKRARRKKAEAGIATTRPPVGYIISGKGVWIKDPDPRVRDIIQLIFDKFLELGSCGAVVRFLRRREVLVPGRTPRHQRTWIAARRDEVLRILKSIVYTGVYEYGRTHRVDTFKPGKRATRRPIPRSQGGWVHVDAHHEPYIQRALWDQIQEQLASTKSMLRVPAGRGEALVQGMLRCTRHKLAFRTWYGYRERRPDAKPKRVASYWCQQSSVTGESTICGRVRARFVDKLVESEILKTLNPPSVGAIEEAANATLREYRLQQRAREDELRRAEQAADEAERALVQTDIRQIHVRKRFSDLLESALRRLGEVRAAQLLRPLHPPLTLDNAELEELRKLLESLPTLWHHPHVSPEQRKAVVRRLIKAVHATPATNTWTIEIEWVGGVRTNLELLTVHGVLAEMTRVHADGLTVSEMVEHLNRKGIVRMIGRAAGTPYTEKRLRKWIQERVRRGRADAMELRNS